MSTPTAQVTVSDVVAAFLKGLTVARVKSDMFSAGVSAQYLDDPKLQNYPIPRVEIRQAEVDLKFAVVETADKGIDQYVIIADLLRAAAPVLISDVLDLEVLPGPQSTDGYASLGARLGAVTELEVLSLTMANQLADALTGERDSLDLVFEQWQKFVNTVLVQAIRAVLTAALQQHGVQVWLDDPKFGSELLARAKSWAQTTHEAAIRGVELAKAEFFDLQLAVKRDQLQDLPEHMVSSIKLTFDVDNYMWTATQDKDGKVVKKLTRL